MEPMWELLEHEDVVKKCFHIHNHFSVVKRMKPKSVEQLAAVLSDTSQNVTCLIYSGKKLCKMYGLGSDGDEYYFKKARYAFYAALYYN